MHLKSGKSLQSSHATNYLTLKKWKCMGCVHSTVATDALVLKHHYISICNASLALCDGITTIVCPHKGPLMWKQLHVMLTSYHIPYRKYIGDIMVPHEAPIMRVIVCGESYDTLISAVSLIITDMSPCHRGCSVWSEGVSIGIKIYK